jgi:hypothetical protein
MSAADVERYVVRKPVYETLVPGAPAVRNRQFPTMTFMSRDLVPEANYHLQVGWITGLPEPNPGVYEHVHDYDEILIHWGGDYRTPQDLGAEIEFYIGGQPIRFNTTTAMFIPRGTPHGPVTWKDYRFPHLQLSLMLGTGSAEEAFGNSGMLEPKAELPKKREDYDYEQYVVRSPMRETGGVFTQGRQAPTMTYMSEIQVNAAKYYIEFGWIWGMVKPNIPEMRHERYDEIVLHVGGDPEDPEDLGANMNFGLGGELLEFDRGYCMFIPRGTNHGPLRWNRVDKPHIEMAIMLGCGTFKEGWEDSFLGELRYD